MHNLIINALIIQMSYAQLHIGHIGLYKLIPSQLQIKTTRTDMVFQ
jgi:hypothetical protein